MPPCCSKIFSPQASDLDMADVREALDDPASAEAPDDVADVVADDRGGRADGDRDPRVDAAGRGGDAGQQQVVSPGGGNTRRLEQDGHEDDDEDQALEQVERRRSRTGTVVGTEAPRPAAAMTTRTMAAIT